mmetsp:Transcript_13390/g.19150  ORF Transcript_13390/g.19150 Transcript_13390/m.19150 type:complete len:582 (-) Transcript_13390:360-2105(-)|eukprot:CAMPEP_0184864494 /NCGR_PEP_ID=MMETSP0580-20130426/15183_1 /TAXON_ID=1118495 /ORGANISM="Dactyliosolen fragilissimus" /LENGTH=581 /DNA_ID=CAMNT_0027363315 /DNA_START=86 /DNA_END=1831 /DNA_ORIENTATION=+
MANEKNAHTIKTEDIIALASHLGYRQRRPEASSTLFFVQDQQQQQQPSFHHENETLSNIKFESKSSTSSSDNKIKESNNNDTQAITPSTPILINIYYTTKSIMTYMDHPKRGTNELWRSHAYNTLEELGNFFCNPREHSNKGYRRKEDAVRGCVACGEFFKRKQFSLNQWSKGPEKNKCKRCVEREVKSRMGDNNDKEFGYGYDTSYQAMEKPKLLTPNDVTMDNLSKDIERITLGDSTYPKLTSDLLQLHDRSSSKNNNNDPYQQHHSKSIRHTLERRQFNCPVCPSKGRGKQVFFKKVPIFKPITKCPKCKRETRGKCDRIYPVPKDMEKGYGLYKCTKCNDFWGSSRAVANIGQSCYGCSKNGVETFVKPFRIEVFRPNHIAVGGFNGGNTSGSGGNGNGKDSKKFPTGILGGGPRKTRRVPKEPISEDTEAKISYKEEDERRRNNGGYANGGRNCSDGNSILYVPIDEDNVPNDNICNTVPITPNKAKIPKGYVHKCEACASGICKSRYLPISVVHDSHDGDTVSTNASIVTDSSIDKTDYIDRDMDFDAYEGDWVTVSYNKDKRFRKGTIDSDSSF